MKLSFKSTIFLIIMLLNASVIFSQEKRNVSKDTIRTENITVYKTYNPTINDAFKLKTSPIFDLEKNVPKKVSPFAIKSVPVASTFIPKKAKSLALERKRKILPPQNYVSLAGGNFGNIEAEAFVNYELGRDEHFSGLFLHKSSQGGIDEVRVDDFYYDTGIQLSYQKEDRNTPWGLTFEAQHQLYNWYGLSDDLVISDQQLTNLDPSHTFFDINIGGNITFSNTFIKNAHAKLRFFFDDYDSSEINFIAQPNFNFEIENIKLDVPATLDVLSGSFEPENFLSELKYQRINLGVKPSIPLNYNDIEFNIGFSTFLSADTENNKTDLYIYPNLLATYQFKDYGITIFGGITGNLEQNTYHNASIENKFVAPLLNLQPTSERFKVEVGLQGNLSSKLSYEVKASYNSEEDKALFQKLPILNTIENASNFGFNNAFGYVYADTNTGELTGSLTYEEYEKYTLSLTTNFFTYNVKEQEEAWNLPQLTTTLRGTYVVNEKLDLGANLFFIGTRKDFDNINNRTVDVEAIFDISLEGSYSITKKWKAFAKIKNITNQNYERWLDYPSQSIQGLLGIRYLFK